METNVLYYIPVLDQENPNAASLTNAQKEQVKFFNATSIYTAGQVASNLGNDQQAKINSMGERLRFINARTTVLVNRCIEDKTVTWHLNNLNFAIGLIMPQVTVGIGEYKFTEDTSLALDKESIPNLISLYTYELMQLAMLV